MGVFVEISREFAFFMHQSVARMVDVIP